MKLNRYAKAAGAALLAIKMFSPTAEAQTAIPRPTGVARRAPSHLTAGVNIRTGRFSARVRYERGVPYYGGYWGYTIGLSWYPFGYGPNPYLLPPLWIRQAQLHNISRPYLPIGGRVVVFDGTYSARYADNAHVSDLERENEALRAQLREYELEEARREGYEQARMELEENMGQERRFSAPVMPQIQTEPHVFGYAENGRICNDQYQSEGNALLNRMFNEIAERGGERLHAYTYSRGGRPYTAVLRGDELLLTEDFSSFTGRTGGDFVDYMDGVATRLGIDRSAYLDITFLGHSGRCQ